MRSLRTPELISITAVITAVMLTGCVQMTSGPMAIHAKQGPLKHSIPIKGHTYLPTARLQADGCFLLHPSLDQLRLQVLMRE